MQHRLHYRLAATAIIASVLIGGGTVATAQPGPEPAATAMPQTTPEPAPTPMPAATPVPAAPTPDASGITPLKQGGVNENSNGPNWLDKFNRKPGPDLEAMPAAPPANVKRPRIKIKKARAHPPG